MLVVLLWCLQWLLVHSVVCAVRVCAAVQLSIAAVAVEVWRRARVTLVDVALCAPLSVALAADGALACRVTRCRVARVGVQLRRRPCRLLVRLGALDVDVDVVRAPADAAARRQRDGSAQVAPAAWWRQALLRRVHVRIDAATLRVHDAQARVTLSVALRTLSARAASDASGVCVQARGDGCLVCRADDACVTLALRHAALRTSPSATTPAGVRVTAAEASVRCGDEAALVVLQRVCVRSAAQALSTVTHDIDAHVRIAAAQLALAPTAAWLHARDAMTGLAAAAAMVRREQESGRATQQTAQQPASLSFDVAVAQLRCDAGVECADVVVRGQVDAGACRSGCGWQVHACGSDVTLAASASHVRSLQLSLWACEALTDSPFAASSSSPLWSRGVDVRDGLGFAVVVADGRVRVDEALTSFAESLYDLVVALVYDDEDTHVYLRSNDDDDALPSICGRVKVRGECALCVVGHDTEQRACASDGDAVPTLCFRNSNNSSDDEALSLRMARYADKRTEMDMTVGNGVSMCLDSNAGGSVDVLAAYYCAARSLQASLTLLPPSHEDLAHYAYSRAALRVSLAHGAFVPHTPALVALWTQLMSPALPLCRLRSLAGRLHMRSRLRGAPPPPTSPTSHYAVACGYAACVRSNTATAPTSASGSIATCVYTPAVFPLDLVVEFAARDSALLQPCVVGGSHRHGGDDGGGSATSPMLALRTRVSHCDMHVTCSDARVRVELCAHTGTPQPLCGDAVAVCARHGSTTVCSDEGADDDDVAVVRLVYTYDARPPFASVTTATTTTTDATATVVAEEVYNVSISGRCRAHSHRATTTAPPTSCACRPLVVTLDANAVVAWCALLAQLHDSSGDDNDNAPAAAKARAPVRRCRLTLCVSSLHLCVPCVRLTAVLREGVQLTLSPVSTCVTVTSALLRVDAAAAAAAVSLQRDNDDKATTSAATMTRTTLSCMRLLASPAPARSTNDDDDDDDDDETTTRGQQRQQYGVMYMVTSAADDDDDNATQQLPQQRHVLHMSRITLHLRVDAWALQQLQQLSQQCARWRKRSERLRRRWQRMLVAAVPACNNSCNSVHDNAAMLAKATLSSSAPSQHRDDHNEADDTTRRAQHSAWQVYVMTCELACLWRSLVSCQRRPRAACAVAALRVMAHTLRYGSANSRHTHARIGNCEGALLRLLPLPATTTGSSSSSNTRTTTPTRRRRQQKQRACGHACNGDDCSSCLHTFASLCRCTSTSLPLFVNVSLDSDDGNTAASCCCALTTSPLTFVVCSEAYVMLYEWLQLHAEAAATAPQDKVAQRRTLSTTTTTASAAGTTTMTTMTTVVTVPSLHLHFIDAHTPTQVRQYVRAVTTTTTTTSSTAPPLRVTTAHAATNDNGDGDDGDVCDDDSGGGDSAAASAVTACNGVVARWQRCCVAVDGVVLHARTGACTDYRLAVATLTCCVHSPSSQQQLQHGTRHHLRTPLLALRDVDVCVTTAPQRSVDCRVARVQCVVDVTALLLPLVNYCVVHPRRRLAATARHDDNDNNDNNDDDVDTSTTLQCVTVAQSVWLLERDVVLSRRRCVLHFVAHETNHITVYMQQHCITLDTAATATAQQPQRQGRQQPCDDTDVSRVLVLIDDGLTVTFVDGTWCLPIHALYNVEDNNNNSHDSSSVGDVLLPYFALGEGSYMDCTRTRICYRDIDGNTSSAARQRLRDDDEGDDDDDDSSSSSRDDDGMTDARTATTPQAVTTTMMRAHVTVSSLAMHVYAPVVAAAAVVGHAGRMWRVQTSTLDVQAQRLLHYRHQQQRQHAGDDVQRNSRRDAAVAPLSSGDVRLSGLTVYTRPYNTTTSRTMHATARGGDKSNNMLHARRDSGGSSSSGSSARDATSTVLLRPTSVDVCVSRHGRGDGDGDCADVAVALSAVIVDVLREDVLALCSLCAQLHTTVWRRCVYAACDAAECAFDARVRSVLQWRVCAGLPLLPQQQHATTLPASTMYAHMHTRESSSCSSGSSCHDDQDNNSDKGTTGGVCDKDDDVNATLHSSSSSSHTSATTAATLAATRAADTTAHTFVVFVPSCVLTLSEMRSPLSQVRVDGVALRQTASRDGALQTCRVQCECATLQLYGKGRWDVVLLLPSGSALTWTLTASSSFSSHVHTAVDCSGVQLHASRHVVAKACFVARQLAQLRRDAASVAATTATALTHEDNNKADDGEGTHTAITHATAATTATTTTTMQQQPSSQASSHNAPATHRFCNMFDYAFYLYTSALPAHTSTQQQQDDSDDEDDDDDDDEQLLVCVPPGGTADMLVPYTRAGELWLTLYTRDCVRRRRRNTHDAVDDSDNEATDEGDVSEQWVLNRRGRRHNAASARIVVAALQYGRAVGVVVHDTLVVLSCTEQTAAATTMTGSSTLPWSSSCRDAYTTSNGAKASSSGSGEDAEGTSTSAARWAAHTAATAAATTAAAAAAALAAHESAAYDAGLIVVHIHPKLALRNTTGEALYVHEQLLDEEADDADEQPQQQRSTGSASARRGVTHSSSSIVARTRRASALLPSGGYRALHHACTRVRLTMLVSGQLYTGIMHTLTQTDKGSTNDDDVDDDDNTTIVLRARVVDHDAEAMQRGAAVSSSSPSRADTRPVVLVVAVQSIAASLSTVLTLQPRMAVLNHMGVPVRVAMFQHSNARVAVAAHGHGNAGAQQHTSSSSFVALAAHDALPHRASLPILHYDDHNSLALTLAFAQSTGERIATTDVCVVAGATHRTPRTSRAQQQRRRRGRRARRVLATRQLTLRDGSGRAFCVHATVLSRVVVLSVSMWVYNLTDYALLLTTDTMLSRRLLPGLSSSTGIVPSQGTPFLLGSPLQTLRQLFVAIGLDGGWSAAVQMDVGASGVVTSPQRTLALTRSCNYLVQLPHAQRGQPVTLVLTPRWVVCNCTRKHLLVHFASPQLTRALRRVAEAQQSNGGDEDNNKNKKDDGDDKGNVEWAALSSVSCVPLRPGEVHVSCVGAREGNAMALRELLEGSVPSLTTVSDTAVRHCSPADVYTAQRTPYLSLDAPTQAMYNLWATPRLHTTTAAARTAMARRSEAQSSVADAAVVTGRVSVTVREVDHVLAVVLTEVHETNIHIHNRLRTRAVMAHPRGDEHRHVVPAQHNRRFAWEHNTQEHVLRVHVVGCKGQWYDVDYRHGRGRVTWHCLGSSNNNNSSNNNDSSNSVCCPAYFVHSMTRADGARGVVVLVTETPVPTYAGMAMSSLPLLQQQQQHSLQRRSSMLQLSVAFARVTWLREAAATTPMAGARGSGDRAARTSDAGAYDTQPFVSLVLEGATMQWLDAHDTHSIFAAVHQLQLVDEDRHAVTMYRARPRVRASSTDDGDASASAATAAMTTATRTSPQGGVLRRLRHFGRDTHVAVLPNDCVVSCSVTRCADGVRRVADADVAVTPLVLALNDYWLAAAFDEYEGVAAVTAAMTAQDKATGASRMCVPSSSSSPSSSCVVTPQRTFVTRLAASLATRQDAASHNADNNNNNGSSSNDHAPAVLLLLVERVRVARVTLYLSFTRHRSDPLRRFFGLYTLMLPRRLQQTALYLPELQLRQCVETAASLQTRLTRWARHGLREQWAKVTRVGTVLRVLTRWRGRRVLPLLHTAPHALTLQYVQYKRDCRASANASNVTAAAEFASSCSSSPSSSQYNSNSTSSNSDSSSDDDDETSVTAT